MIEYLLNSLKADVLLSGSECAVAEIDHPTPDFAREEQACEPRSLMEAFEQATSTQHRPRVEVSFDASEEPVLTPSPSSPSPQDLLSSTPVRASSVTDIGATENEVAAIMHRQMAITRRRELAICMRCMSQQVAFVFACMCGLQNKTDIYVSCRYTSNRRLLAVWECDWARAKG